ncbi:hypothetical protein D3C84_870430 [compost metagenome]
MLGEAWLARQARTAHKAAQPRGQQLVVEAPAQIQHLGLLVVRPPAVLVAFTADFTQCIDITHVADDLVHPGPFRSQEAWRLLAVTPVLDVELLLRHVQRTAVDVLATLATLLVQIAGEVVH